MKQNHVLIIKQKGIMKSFINFQIVKTFYRPASNPLSLQSFFQDMKKKYSKSFKQQTFDFIQNLTHKLNHKHFEQKQESQIQDLESFVYGEFKIFTWVLVVYCHTYGLILEELNDTHFAQIQTIFESKSLIFVKYEALCLVHERQKFEKAWSEEQITLLTQIVTCKHAPNEWRVISFELFKQSEGKHYRPFQQCRQKWFNYLDPRVNRGEWTEDQDIALLTAADFLGCKWALISRELGGVRTEHMVKNRYKSLISKWKKKFKKTGERKIISFILKNYEKRHKKVQLDCFTFSEFTKSKILQSSPQKEDNPRILKQETQVSASQHSQIQPQVEIIQKSQPERQLKEEQLENEEQFDLGYESNAVCEYHWNHVKASSEEDQDVYTYALEKKEFYAEDKKLIDYRRTAEEQQDSNDSIGLLIYETELKNQQRKLKGQSGKTWESGKMEWLMDKEDEYEANQWMQTLQMKPHSSWLDDYLI